MSRADRDMIVELLREEIIGPSPQGEPLDPKDGITFSQRKDTYVPRVQPNGEEILMRSPPVVRYGAGVLHPIAAGAERKPRGTDGEEGASDEDEEPLEADVVADAYVRDAAKIADRSQCPGEDDPHDRDVQTSDTLRPSSVGISFLADLKQDARLRVQVTGGRYEARRVVVGDVDHDYTWYLRIPVELSAEEAAERLRSQPRRTFELHSGPLSLTLEVFVRPFGKHHLVTVTLVNRTELGAGPTPGSGQNEISLFQTRIEATLEDPMRNDLILPYPSSPLATLNEDERTLQLLYRKAETYAIGHGCAADWTQGGNPSRATAVATDPFPTYETPSVTPDLRREDGTPLEVPMGLLAGFVDGENGFDLLEEIIERYEAWIDDRAAEIPSLDTSLEEAAKRHVSDCAAAARRMREGLAFLEADPVARKAFRLANHAMALQRFHSARKRRDVQFSKSDQQFVFKPALASSRADQNDLVGRWRAFQIAFLLMSVGSTADGTHPDRGLVDLIWFPTGGGKTEAYLGLAAFGLLMRRFRDPGDAGVHVLMRYTLRLLTAQQFQRASSLICALESLRRQSPELGSEPYSIGIWLGSSVTPNKRSVAVKALAALNRSAKAENPFVVDKCPWCGAPLGAPSGNVPKGVPRALGYQRRDDTVAIHCPDRACEFHDGLPVHVIDEDIYDVRPSLVIGTVDKFALLAWSPEARNIFGLDASGARRHSPPGLIIQDELHLISGPLGSMVGLYEALIEELCTDARGDVAIVPKIVCSTATIRSYRDQIRALYGRDRSALFPPPGLEDGDSFFARVAVDDEGNRLPGRQYVGVYAPGLRTLETAQQRAFASLLQAPMHLPPEARDPYWSLMLFFGSLGELGTSLYLLQSSVPDYLRVIMNRRGLEFSELRSLFRVEELTGRLNNHEIPAALNKLEAPYAPDKIWKPGDPPVKDPPVDVCLASSIIEVGVDIDRLSLMAVVRQPKTTAQYIQVTGRVGRRWWERPGLVVTLFNPKSPRDRSHFEQFRSYHEKLYAYVEPTSVTPFSPRVLDRALHAVMAGFVRQAGSEEAAASPHPYPAEVLDYLRTILLARVERVDAKELPYFEEVFQRRAGEWRRRQRAHWYVKPGDDEIPLMVRAGEYLKPEREIMSWKTPMSMRNVDAECQAQISQLYLLDEELASESSASHE